MTPQQIEAMKLALEALENISSFQNHTSGDSSDADKAITAIKEALAQTQEPVAWPCLIDSADFSENTITLVMQCEDYKVSAGTHWLSTTPQQRTEQEPFCLHWEDRWGCNHYADPKEPHPVNAKPLYTTPPQRTWVGLTDEQRSQLVTLHHGWNEYGQAIEASLKQQNGYAEEKNT